MLQYAMPFPLPPNLFPLSLITGQVIQPKRTGGPGTAKPLGIVLGSTSTFGKAVVDLPLELRMTVTSMLGNNIGRLVDNLLRRTSIKAEPSSIDSMFARGSVNSGILFGVPNVRK